MEQVPYPVGLLITLGSVAKESGWMAPAGSGLQLDSRGVSCPPASTMAVIVARVAAGLLGQPAARSRTVGVDGQVRGAPSG